MAKSNAPRGNLAYFIKDFKHAGGLVKLGALDEGQELLRKSDPTPVMIRQA